MMIICGFQPDVGTESHPGETGLSALLYISGACAHAGSCMHDIVV